MRKWKMRLSFSDGITSLSSVTLPEIASFIKEYRIRNRGNSHSTLPLEMWLLDIAFDRALAYHPMSELTDATISQEHK